MKLNGESKGIFLIFFCVIVATLLGFRSSFMRERDIQRVLDIGALEVGINKYYSEFGFYPEASVDGRIVACIGDKTVFETDSTGKVKFTSNKKVKLLNLIPCEWGKDPLGDAGDLEYPPYVSIIPKDPLSDKGGSYKYLSNGKHYQILASFETKEINDYDPDIKKRREKCGNVICNFGRSDGIILSKSISE